MTTPHSTVARSGFVLFLLFGLSLGGFVFPLARAQGLEVYEIEGLVQDEKGAALPGAFVYLDRQADGYADNVTTDASGKYHFTMVSEGSHVVSAWHKCCQWGSANVTVGGTTIKGTPPPITLAPRETPQSGDVVQFSGIVKSTKDGHAVSDVLVEVTSYWQGDGSCSSEACAPSGGAQYLTTSTGPDGRFQLEVNRGTAYVRASFDGYDATSGNLEVSNDRDVSIPLRPAEDRSARLHGILKNIDGEPVAGWVYASPDYSSCPPEADCVMPASTRPADGDGEWYFESRDAQYGSAQAGKDGAWEMRISAGRLRVSGQAEDYLEAFKVLDLASGDDVEVDLALEPIPPDSVVVKGRVVDRSTGKPIEGAQVGLENQKWGTWASAQTDADGRYEVKTKPGFTIATARVDAYIVCMAAASDGAEGKSIAAPCDAGPRSDEYLPAAVSFVAEENGEVVQDFKLLPRPAAKSEFKGYVLNESSGKAIPNATVTFYNEITRDWGSAMTDADGSYKISVHAGYYSIRVWAPHYYDGVLNAEIAEKQSQRLDFKLAPGEKRYGYWAYGGYQVKAAMAEGGADASGAPTQQGLDAAPVPTEGQKVYEGSGGGLGPYHEAQGGKSPSVGLFVALAAVFAAFAWRRRD